MSELSALANDAIDPSLAITVSELHGSVVGIAVCGPEKFSMQHLVDLLGVDALSNEAAVDSFVSAALQALAADDLSFSPMLARS